MYSSVASSPAPSKTNAFFASSFTASPPLPRPPAPIKKFSSGSSTESNDEPVTPSSAKAEHAPTPSIFASAKPSRFNVSRIFPSRYTRARRDSEDRLDIQPALSPNVSRKKPDFLQLEIGPDITSMDHSHHYHKEHVFNDIFLSLPTPGPFHDRSGSDSSFSPPSSICSSNSHVEIPLHTSPPSPPLLILPLDSDFTPRPADQETSFSAAADRMQFAKAYTSPAISSEVHEGDVVADTGASSALPTLRLQQPLGQGAFSAVWLAEDLTPVPLTLASKKSVRDLKRKASLQKKGSLSRDSSVKSTSSNGPSRTSSLTKLRKRLGGVRPTVEAVLLEGHSRAFDDEGSLLLTSPRSSPLPPPSPLSAHHSPLPGSISRSNSTESRRSFPISRLVAVKLTPRRADPDPLTEERTRVGFIREVEVLRHISHPNITPLLSYFTTPSHHVLVLPYLKGGDLLSLVNNDAAWNRLSENVLRRIWCELCRAVGWMHSVGIVHRDIKLENILVNWEELAANDSPSPFQLSQLPSPLIKLTDFGLSRFIDIGNGARGQGEMLSTRCGSEAYAAPELVMGGGPRGVYDARETDAWACGVVLYALVGRSLPFGEGVGMDGIRGNTSRIGGERAHAYGFGSRKHAAERRAWLMRIARGEYEWPEVSQDAISGAPEDGELVGPRLPLSKGARRVVGRLLVRDPKKRSMIVDLWEDEWMREDEVGAVMWENLQLSEVPTLPADQAGVFRPESRGNPIHFHAQDGLDSLGEGEWEPLGEGSSEGGDYNEEEDEEGEEDGWLLDEGGIASIARQEVV